VAGEGGVEGGEGVLDGGLEAVPDDIDKPESKTL
jgi:hypothetical protein